MSITSDLRGFAMVCDEQTKKTLLMAADRIDAEHQKAEDGWRARDGQMWLKGYSECHAELMEGSEVIAADLEKAGWVRGPLDADGEPWHIGDEIANEHNYHLTVSEITYKGNGCWMLHAEPKWSFYANLARHHHSPTVEDILREFTDAILEWAGKSGTVAEVGYWSEVAAEYIAKLQLREDV